MWNKYSCEKFHPDLKLNKESETLIEKISKDDKLNSVLKFVLNFLGTTLTAGSWLADMGFQTYSILNPDFHMSQDTKRIYNVFTSASRFIGHGALNLVELDNKVKLVNPESNMINAILNIEFNGDWSYLEKQFEDIYSKETASYQAYDYLAFICILINETTSSLMDYTKPLDSKNIMSEFKKMKDKVQDSLRRIDNMNDEEIRQYIKDNHKEFLSERQMILIDENKDKPYLIDNFIDGISDKKKAIKDKFDKEYKTVLEFNERDMNLLTKDERKKLESDLQRVYNMQSSKKDLLNFFSGVSSNPSKTLGIQSDSKVINTLTSLFSYDIKDITKEQIKEGRIPEELIKKVLTEHERGEIRKVFATSKYTNTEYTKESAELGKALTGIMGNDFEKIRYDKLTRNTIETVRLFLYNKKPKIARKDKPSDADMGKAMEIVRLIYEKIGQPTTENGPLSYEDARYYELLSLDPMPPVPATDVKIFETVKDYYQLYFNYNEGRENLTKDIEFQQYLAAAKNIKDSNIDSIVDTYNKDKRLSIVRNASITAYLGALAAIYPVLSVILRLSGKNVTTSFLNYKKLANLFDEVIGIVGGIMLGKSFLRNDNPSDLKAYAKDYYNLSSLPKDNDPLLEDLSLHMIGEMKKIPERFKDKGKEEKKEFNLIKDDIDISDIVSEHDKIEKEMEKLQKKDFHEGDKKRGGFNNDTDTDIITKESKLFGKTTETKDKCSIILDEIHDIFAGKFDINDPESIRWVTNMYDQLLISIKNDPVLIKKFGSMIQEAQSMMKSGKFDLDIMMKYHNAFHGKEAQKDKQGLLDMYKHLLSLTKDNPKLADLNEFIALSIQILEFCRAFGSPKNKKNSIKIYEQIKKKFEEKTKEYNVDKLENLSHVELFDLLKSMLAIQSDLMKLNVNSVLLKTISNHVEAIDYYRKQKVADILIKNPDKFFRDKESHDKEKAIQAIKNQIIYLEKGANKKEHIDIRMNREHLIEKFKRDLAQLMTKSMGNTQDTLDLNSEEEKMLANTLMNYKNNIDINKDGIRDTMKSDPTISGGIAGIIVHDILEKPRTMEDKLTKKENKTMDQKLKTDIHRYLCTISSRTHEISKLMSQSFLIGIFITWCINRMHTVVVSAYFKYRNEIISSKGADSFEDICSYVEPLRRLHLKERQNKEYTPEKK